MADYGFPLLFALGLWWFSTGVVLYLDNLPGRTFRWTLMGGSVVLAIAIFVLIVSSASTGVAGAYVAFTAGVVIWGVIEMSYFTGLITGPRKTACPPGCSKWKRFGLAILTSLYHELLILGTVLFMVLATWSEPNKVGTWTFVVLWIMRWSAKLNLFLGVPNLNEDWLPEPLRYLKTYMVKRGMNLLFPVSVTLATIVDVLIVLHALSPDVTGADAVGLILVASLLGLAILEHWFLVLPLPDEALWAWALPAHESHDDQDGEGRSPDDSMARLRVLQPKTSHHPDASMRLLAKTGRL
jgi:putative photosynthetic complex assembly protein 2